MLSKVSAISGSAFNVRPSTATIIITVFDRLPSLNLEMAAMATPLTRTASNQVLIATQTPPLSLPALP